MVSLERKHSADLESNGSRAAGTGSFRQGAPATSSVLRDPGDELVIFLRRPGAPFDSIILAAWRATHGMKQTQTQRPKDPQGKSGIRLQR